MAEGFAALETALGVHFRDPRLLALALTHPSAAGGGEDNQRLEFLGDAALELSVSLMLFERHPGADEGELTRARAALVREESLSRAAQRIDLGRYIRLDRGEDASGGREKPSVLADAMEAVLGAAMLDGGLDAVRKIVRNVLPESAPEAAANWKSLLQEREQAKGFSAPVYRVIAEEGPPHARAFTVEARLAEGGRGVGRGASKKQAEQEAAKQAYEEQ